MAHRIRPVDRVVLLLLVGGLLVLAWLRAYRHRAGEATTCPHPIAVRALGRLSVVCAASNLSVDEGLARAQATGGEVVPLPASTRLLLGLPIDVNRATATDLELLPRIGPSLAQRIIRERTAHGPFHSLADLRRVRGIGATTVKQLRSLTAFPPPASPPPRPPPLNPD